jgi:hypothetical protein
MYEFIRILEYDHRMDNIIVKSISIVVQELEFNGSISNNGLVAIILAFQFQFQ